MESYDSFSVLQSHINNHKCSCKDNQIQRFGDLIIGFYSYGIHDYLVGLFNDELVFIFEADMLNIHSVTLLDGFIKIDVFTGFIILDLNDYTVR